VSARLNQASLPHAAAVDDIAEHLRPLKPGVGDPGPGIVLAIDATRTVAPQLAPVLRWREIRDKADRACKALSTLINEMAPRPPPFLVQALEWADMWRHVEGPDPRLDVLKWLCANTACLLIEQFSEKEPSNAPNGNLHYVAMVIYSVLAPDQPVTETGLLRACRKVNKWRVDIRASKRIWAKKPDDAL
jgi:hypothetical protein